MLPSIPSIAKRFISYIGKTTITAVETEWQPPCERALADFTKKNPTAAKAEIKGSKPHKSHHDPNDSMEVISIRVLDSDDKRLGTIHVHQDGTYTLPQSQK
ncbi:hypothetical protein C8T65DRAFT_228633 [Cerioporus squamosus]|nr:hypothetical protein C8T65DRAFT_228633 [Cerioporus squamosus]